jgi:hypothetical protein
MRQRVIAELRNPNGAEAKGARYRETLQTTGFYVDRIVIVPGESAPILQSLPVRRQRRNSDGHQNAFSQAWRNLSLRWRVGFQPGPGRSIASRQWLHTLARERVGRNALSSSAR